MGVELFLVSAALVLVSMSTSLLPFLYHGIKSLYKGIGSVSGR